MLVAGIGEGNQRLLLKKNGERGKEEQIVKWGDGGEAEGGRREYAAQTWFQGRRGI